MRTYLLACTLLCSLALGCTKSGKNDQNPDPAQATDALWALAPADTLVGVVAGGGTGDMLLAAWAELARSLATRPGGQKAVDEIMTSLRNELPAAVLDADARTRMGLDLSRGSAVFLTSNGLIAVLPVADRAAFRSAFDGRQDNGTDHIGGGMCKEMAGHYVCAHTADKLDGVGKSEAMARTVTARPATLRGHVEIAVSAQALAEAEKDSDMAWLRALSDLQGVDAAIKLERGGFTARARLRAIPADARLKAFVQVSDTLAQKVAKKNPMGIWRVRVPWRDLMPVDELSRELAPVAAMANLGSVKDDIIDNLTGELVLYPEPGEARRFVLEIGATRPQRLQPLITTLCTLAAPAAPMLRIAMDGDRCIATIDEATMRAALPDAPISGDMTLSLYTTDTALAASMSISGKRAGRAVDPGPLGRELLSEPWSMAVWGYGNAATFGTPETFAALKGSPGYEEAMTVLWVVAHVTELGMAAAIRDDGVHLAMRLGTQWANPDEILHPFQENVSKILDGQPGAIEALDALAQKWPDSPLARTHAAGADGIMATSGAVGVLAAIAIPPFMKYIKKSKESEARYVVYKLFDGVLGYYDNPPEGAAGRLPAPSVGPTPPLGTCCAQGGKCAPNPDWWAHPTWQALQFSVDAPHYYSFQYELVDDSNFVVRAFGDLDCDGTYSTFEMRGEDTGDGLTSSVGLTVENELE